MKSTLYYFSLLLVLVQIAFSQTIVFSENFDGESHEFTIVNGEQTNQWIIGTNADANPSGSTKAAYISNDSSSYNYIIDGSSSVVHLYTDITLPENQDEYNLTFDWKGNGENNYDYLGVFLVDTSDTPVAGSEVLNSRSIGTFNGSSDWKQAKVYFQIPMSGSQTVKRLVFSWHNNNNLFGTQPPAAIDNILLAVAEPIYSIEQSGNEFIITNGTSENAKTTIKEVINYIKTEANGENISIQFGDGENELDIGTESINFYSGGWGKIMLLGKITSASVGAIYIGDGVSVESVADIRKTPSYSNGDYYENYAISNRGTLIINGGTISTISTIASNNHSTAIYISYSGTVTINDGTISATEGGYAIYNTSSSGTINITGGDVSTMVSNIDYDDCVIQNSSSGKINITGGTISAIGDNGYEYSICGNAGPIVLGGTPNILNKIKTTTGILSVIASGENIFDPGDKQYTLELSLASNNNMVAVSNAANYISNFNIETPDLGAEFELAASDNNLILSIVNGYLVSANETYYTITKDAGGFATIGQAINHIGTESNGTDVSIQFGDGTNELDINKEEFRFGGANSPNWGKVMLFGKVTSQTTSISGIMYISANISVESKADIRITSNHKAISNYGNLTISGGAIAANSNAISNDGALTINGGTIFANNYAVDNSRNKILVLCNSPKITGKIRVSAEYLKIMDSCENVFAPNDEIYTIELISYSEGAIVIEGGADFISNFTLADDIWELEAKNGNLVATKKMEDPTIAFPLLNAKTKISIQKIGNSILLENLPINTKVELYNLHGKQVYSVMSVEAQCIVPLRTKGMYIVKAGAETFGITLK